MKTKLKMSCIGLSLKDNESKDGKHYYQLSIDQDGEAGSLPISEECYLNVKDVFKKYSPVSLDCEFNDQYKSLRVLNITPMR